MAMKNPINPTTKHIFCFRVRRSNTEQEEDMLVEAFDFVQAVMTLATWFPGLHILKLKGVYSGAIGRA